MVLGRRAEAVGDLEAGGMSGTKPELWRIDQPEPRRRGGLRLCRRADRRARKTALVSGSYADVGAERPEMTKREPGRLPQTTEGAELLELRRPPSPWARRLLWASLAVLLVAATLLIAGVFPERREAVRDRPEAHRLDQGAPTIVPGARAAP
jgi:hypothetical protein